MELQERVEGKDYPPRVVLQAHNGADPSGLVQVKFHLCQTLVLEHVFSKNPLGEFL